MTYRRELTKMVKKRNSHYLQCWHSIVHTLRPRSLQRVLYYGVGAVLLQKQQQPDSCWKPLAYASRALTETECHYALVEKEALACTWAAEKFADYVLVKMFTKETDHKPLLGNSVGKILLGNKNLDNLPPRILQF